MSPVACLLRPRWLQFRNAGRSQTSRGLRSLLLILLGALFWTGAYLLTHRVLAYFRSVPEIGDILAHKLLSMVLVTFLVLLLFSAVLTCLAKLYLSRDLPLVHSLPVRGEQIFLARWIESTADSAWMVMLYTLPVLVAYGQVYEAGFLFYCSILLALLPLCLIASVLAALAVMLAVILLPASRIRSIFVFLGLSTTIALYLAFRMLQPERLVNPETSATVLLYLQNLATPASPLLPSTWAFDALRSALDGRWQEALFHAGLAWSAALFLTLLNVQVARRLYFKGYSRSQAAAVRLFRGASPAWMRLLDPLPGPWRALVGKEFKTFWRDQTQWSQLFLLAALVVIYLYNFSVLPLQRSPMQTLYLQNLLSFLNMALAAFVLTAISARFAFPSVSVEGSAFWIVRCAPISLRAFLWIKFGTYLLPLLVLAETLVVATNRLLHVTPFMMGLSTVTLLFITPAIVGLAVGLGAAYPDFAAENPTQAVTGFGGLIFMILSAAYIGAVTVLEAGPVYTLFMSGMKSRSLSGWQMVWVVGSFALVAALSALTLLLPMRFGERRLASEATRSGSHDP